MEHIGVVVGHELTHGFDDQGRQFESGQSERLVDSRGREEVRRASADCEVKEYGEFSVDGGVHLNGKLTLGENTADNGGIGWPTWPCWMMPKRKSTDVQTKQDGFTPVQQFFFGWAQNYCGEIRPQLRRMQVQTDPHSPDAVPRQRDSAEHAVSSARPLAAKWASRWMPQNICRCGNTWQREAIMGSLLEKPLIRPELSGFCFGSIKAANC